MRLTKVTRHDDRHDLSEISVDVELTGDFDASYTDGDNRLIVATDSIRNTVYVLARSHPLGSLEAFGMHLGRHFVDGYPQVASATIQLTQSPWERIQVGSAPHPRAFIGGGAERRVCTVTTSREEARVHAGLEDLLVLKTTDSEFLGFARDRFTTLPDTTDRILATSVSARWSYGRGRVEPDWNAAYGAIRQAMLEVFATHHSLSVQQTLYFMGEAALAACPQIDEVTLHLPNRHRLLVNLAPFGLDNPNVIFTPTEEPFGMISGTLRRPA